MKNLRHLIDLKDFTKTEVDEILRTAESFQRGTLKAPLFFEPKCFIASFFLENSTRTKTSFEIAAKKIGLEFVAFDTENSSLSKGESLLESLKCLELMGVRAVVTRWKEEGLLRELQKDLNMSLVCAGEGTRSHPSQAILDYFTLREAWETWEGKKLLIVGDLKHSRVFASHRELAKIYKVELLYTGPEEQLPELGYGKKVELDEVLSEVDAIMMLRAQHERHSKQWHIGDYHKEFGLNSSRLTNLSRQALILHPGPFNLGVEIAQEALVDKRSRVHQQVHNSVWVRMAIWKYILGE